MDLTPEYLAKWHKWLDEHSIVRELAEKFPPWKLYKLNGGRTVFPIAYSEEGTIRVRTTYNKNLLFEREVLPEDLEEICG